MNEHDKAKAWREANNWSWAQLGAQIGYSREAVYWMERGCTSRRTEIPEWVWQRYKMACAGLDAQIKRKQAFNW